MGRKIDFALALVLVSNCREPKMICQREVKAKVFNQLISYCVEMRLNPEYPCPASDFIPYHQPKGEKHAVRNR